MDRLNDSNNNYQNWRSALSAQRKVTEAALDTLAAAFDAELNVEKATREKAIAEAVANIEADVRAAIEDIDRESKNALDQESSERVALERLVGYILFQSRWWERLWWALSGKFPKHVAGLSAPSK